MQSEKQTVKHSIEEAAQVLRDWLADPEDPMKTRRAKYAVHSHFRGQTWIDDTFIVYYCDDSTGENVYLLETFTRAEVEDTIWAHVAKSTRTAENYTWRETHRKETEEIELRELVQLWQSKGIAYSIS